MSSTRPNFRITLWDINTTTRWRGTQKAVIYDAKDIGVEEHANDTGSAYWTLQNDHPQISLLSPLQQHYEISRWSTKNSRWEFVAAGILNDYTTTEFETVFTGLDYKSVLNQIYTPLTNMTYGSIASLSTDLSANGITNAPEVPFRVSSSTVTTAERYINTTAVSISSVSMTAFNHTIAQEYYDESFVNFDQTAGTSTYWASPGVEVATQVIWIGTTTAGFTTAGVPLKVRVYASPPGIKDQGEPPLGNTGLISEFQVIGDPGAMYNGYTWNVKFRLYPQELKKAIDADPVDSWHGYDSLTSDDPIYPPQAAPLRTGVTYAFQIYASVYRSSGNGIWYRSPTGKITGGSNTAVNLAEVTIGQQKSDISTLVTKIFEDAVIRDEYSRLKYAYLDISGNTYTTHTTFSAGKPSLTYIADICDLEMGARADGTKALFGISKPIAGATYDGRFKLSLQVSSSAITTGPALRYPENIRSYNYAPGYSRVYNNITVIPSDRYLTGQTGQGSGGTSIIGGTAIDGSTLTTYGTIPLVMSKAGFANAQGAQTEANRLLRNHKLENSRQVGIKVVTNGIDLWDGWDVGDSISVTIKHGRTDISEPFVISGIRWFGESNGVERLEMDLVQGTYFASSFVAPAVGNTAGDATVSPALANVTRQNLFPSTTRR